MYILLSAVDSVSAQCKLQRYCKICGVLVCVMEAPLQCIHKRALAKSVCCVCVLFLCAILSVCCVCVLCLCAIFPVCCIQDGCTLCGSVLDLLDMLCVHLCSCTA